MSELSFDIVFSILIGNADIPGFFSYSFFKIYYKGVFTMDKFDSSTIKNAETTAKILSPLLGAPSELSFKEASQRLFHGRPLRWVKVYITSKYPEVTEGPDAWMTKPRGTGHPVRVTDPIKASVWMLQHGREIPWDADFPETVEAHRNDGGARRPYQDYPENADLKAYHDTYEK